MDRKKISVLTDLDMAETFLKRGRSNRAVNVASVALENAIRFSKEDPIDAEWVPIVDRAFKIKSVAMRRRSADLSD